MIERARMHETHCTHAHASVRADRAEARTSVCTAAQARTCTHSCAPARAHMHTQQHTHLHSARTCTHLRTAAHAHSCTHTQQHTHLHSARTCTQLHTHLDTTHKHAPAHSTAGAHAPEWTAAHSAHTSKHLHTSTHLNTAHITAPEHTAAHSTQARTSARACAGPCNTHANTHTTRTRNTGERTCTRTALINPGRREDGVAHAVPAARVHLVSLLAMNEEHLRGLGSLARMVARCYSRRARPCTHANKLVIASGMRLDAARSVVRGDAVCQSGLHKSRATTAGFLAGQRVQNPKKVEKSPINRFNFRLCARANHFVLLAIERPTPQGRSPS